MPNLPEPRRLRLLCLLLAAATLAVFWPAIHFDFVDYDDNLYVYANPRVLHGLNWENIRWAFSNTDTGYWHPVTWLSFMVDASLSEPRPAVYHLTNILLHTGGVVMLFLTFNRMTGEIFPSALLAAVF